MSDTQPLMIPQEVKDKIDIMTLEELAYNWRFAPVGHPLLQGDVGKYFQSKFLELGGMTPEISKRLGWNRAYTSLYDASGTKVDPTTTLPSPCGACLNSV